MRGHINLTENFSFFSKNFNEDTALRCLLIFQVNTNFLEFTVINKDELCHIGLGRVYFDSSKPWVEQVENSLNTTEALSFEFSSVSVVFRNRIHTLLPEIFYDSSIHQEYLKNCSFTQKNQLNHVYPIKQLQAVNLSEFPADVCDVFQKKYTSCHFYHHHDVLIEASQIIQRQIDTNFVLVNINPNFFDLVIQSKQKLLLCNSYYIEEPEDVLYYILLAFENLNLSQNKTPIFSVGEWANEPTYLNLLQLYFPEYKLLNNAEFYMPTRIGAALPEYTLFTLQNAFLCG